MIDFKHLVTAFTNNNDKILCKVQRVHRKKLCNLVFF